MHHSKRKPYSGRGFTCVWQHTRLPCPSLFPWVCTNPCPLSQWCYPTILSSVTTFHPALSLSQHQDLFQLVVSLHQVTNVLKLQLQHQSFQWIFRVDFLEDWLVWFPCSLRDCQESSPALQFKSTQPSLSSNSHNYTRLLENCTFD